jgi:ubiquinone/menaquinone biosynthesis C-methylase UbiE
MKVRDSGMPEEPLWVSFFSPETILTKLDFTAQSGDIVEFGCGYGTFTVAAAGITTGIVYALDIDGSMIAETNQKVSHSRRKNVRLSQRDFVTDGTGLEAESVGYAMLFNILHGEDPMILLRESYRVLALGGKVGIIHWNYDVDTPRGPGMEIRPRPDQCQEWTVAAGFDLVVPFTDLSPYHYGIVGQKPMGVE